MKILIVEDNVTNQVLLQYFMKVAGHEFTTADNGLQAVNHINDESYDLIFMDIEMPVMNGIEATKQIRLLDGVIPIIALSAYVEYQLIDECYEAGVNAFLAKPYKRSDIYKAIETHSSLLSAS